MPNEIRLTPEERKTLGSEFNQWVDSVEDKRRRLLHEGWIKALNNYEGKEPVKTLPWPGASNVFVPMTPTDVDDLGARHYNAATSNPDAYLITPNRGGDLLPDVSYEKYGRWWQNISRWIENEQVHYNKLIEEVIWTYMIYGDAWVYLPWEVEEVVYKGLGEIEPTTLWDKPMPKVLHPKDVYINWWEKDAQTARKVGFRWNLDLPMIEQLERQGHYPAKEAVKLKELLVGQEEARQKKNKLRNLGLGKGTYYNEHGGNYYNPDEFERALKQNVGIEEESVPHALRMVKMFCRADLDGDGIPEEVVFDVERETGRVPYAKYANLEHRKRPLVHFYYNKRPNCIHNRGVPELLFNMQKLVNQTMRNIMDNNTVQNTKMFAAKKGGPIEENARVYPSRIFFVDNPKEDLVPLELGSGRTNTSISDVGMLMEWAQKLTGVTDPKLGKSTGSRTPATTTLALLEQGSSRDEHTLSVHRESSKEMWEQILMLYYQNGDVNALAKVAAFEDGDEDRFLAAYASIEPKDLLDKIALSANVSSSVLNRQVQRQEALVLYSQVDAAYQRIMMLANMVGGAIQDPAMRELLLLMAKGIQRLTGRVLDTFEIKDQDELNPSSIVKLLEGVTSVEVEAEGGGGEPTGGLSDPAQAAAGLASNAAPGGIAEAAPPGRPTPGLPRVPGPAPGS